MRVKVCLEDVCFKVQGMSCLVCAILLGFKGLGLKDCSVAGLVGVGSLAPTSPHHKPCEVGIFVDADL